MYRNLSKTAKMNARELHLTVDYVGSSGIVFSPEQKAALQTSLCILQNNMKFSRVFLWGKILGVKDDYFIAQGIGSDELGEKKTLYRCVSSIPASLCCVISVFFKC